MKRIPEPRELMDDPAQAEAYARADFGEVHAGIFAWFDRLFPGRPLAGRVIDLGCGPGDMSFRFAMRYPAAEVIGLDGAREMLGHARERLRREPGLAGRLRFVRRRLPLEAFPGRPFSAVVSNSLLHHLADPAVLWETIRRIGSPGTRVFVADLMRPGTVDRARALVDRYASGEPGILRRDFLNSLCAAFEPAEVERQLETAGLPELSVRVISDRHLLVAGTLGG